MTIQIRTSAYQLTAVRILWAVVALITVLILIVGLPTYYSFFEAQMAGGDQALQQIGLPANLRAAYYTILDTIVILVFCITAFVIFWRRSTDSMAILTSIALLSYTIFSYYVPAALTRVYPGWEFPINFVNSVGILSTLAALYVFPDGRFVPQWTRWLVLLLTVWGLTWIIAPGNALDPAVWGDVQWTVTAILLYGIGLAAQVYRYRFVSTPQQRQQSKWVIFGIITAFIGYLISQLPGLIVPSLLEPTTANILFHILRTTIYRGSEALIPLTIVFSILRYRLWDIDFIVNRSVVYGLLTILLGAVFLGLIFLLQSVFQFLTGGGQSTLSAIIATAAVVSLFTPTRNRLRHFIDHRFYKIAIDYQKPKASVVEQSSNKTNLGPYSDLEFVGRGGMAEVYRVMHPTLKRMVAIKLLPANLLNDAHLRKRFEREAKILSVVKHPNIVEVFEFGESGGIPYIVMEYINGEDLREYLAQVGYLRLETVLPILKDIAAALDYLHRQQLVHRDIKPSNIMLERPASEAQTIRRAVLMDFGIAKLLTSATPLTTGVLGTFDYMAPEQIQEASLLDGRVDVYAFTVMLFQLLTGRLPFANSNPGALLIAHLTQPPPDPRQFVADLPPLLTDVIQRGLAKLPADRYASVGELVQALEGIGQPFDQETTS